MLLSRLLVAALLTRLAACSATWTPMGEVLVDTRDSALARTADADGDGYSIAEGDCDDDDPAVNPDATEICDDADVDEDCDGDADDADSNARGGTLSYRDDDADGWGAIDDEGTWLCEVGALATIGGDCDDSNPDLHPGRADPTDGTGIDEDCDGFIDEDGLTPGDLLLTEYYWRGDDQFDGFVPTGGTQWVEIANQSGVTLFPSGWVLRLCHLAGATTEAPPTTEICTSTATVDVRLGRLGVIPAGERRVLCSHQNAMGEGCDLDYDYTGGVPGMSIRHGWAGLLLDGATLGPAATASPELVTLDAVAWWYIDATDYWPNAPASSARLDDAVSRAEDAATANDSYGTPDVDGAPAHSTWCLATETSSWTSDGEEMAGSPGQANGRCADGG